MRLFKKTGRRGKNGLESQRPLIRKGIDSQGTNLEFAEQRFAYGLPVFYVFPPCLQWTKLVRFPPGPSEFAMLGWENSLIDCSTVEAGILLSQPTGWADRLVALNGVRIGVPYQYSCQLRDYIGLSQPCILNIREASGIRFLERAEADWWEYGQSGPLYMFS